ncbi:MAG: response regulator [Treponema sp.]|nr:response regulator [Candidatus Treponema scatequi]
MNREIVKEILEDEKLDIDYADDGDVAVEMVRKKLDDGIDNYYDFILMDVQMPRMNG